MSFTFLFKHGIKGVKTLYFDQLYDLMSEDNRAALNEQFLQNGLSEEGLNKLLEVGLRYDSKVEEIRVSDEHFLFWNKWLMGSSFFTVIPLCEVEHCYCCEHVNRINMCYFGFKFKNGEAKEFQFMHNRQLRLAFDKIQGIIAENNPDSGNSLTTEIIECYKGKFCVNEKELGFISKKSLFKKETTQVIIPNIQDVDWCYQWYENNDEVDYHTLSVYLKNSKEPIDVKFKVSNASSVFDLVLAIKRFAPHLLYRTNPSL